LQENLTEEVAISLQRAPPLAEEEADSDRSAGADGVLLDAGASWNPEAMTLEPSQRRSSRRPGRRASGLAAPAHDGGPGEWGPTRARPAFRPRSRVAVDEPTTETRQVRPWAN